MLHDSATIEANALIQGALILRQTHARNDAARAVKPAAEQLIKAYLPAARINTAPRKLRKRAMSMA